VHGGDEHHVRMFGQGISEGRTAMSRQGGQKLVR
jgi:hypothetical protein